MTATDSNVRPADPAREARYADPILLAARELAQDGEWTWADLAEVAAEAAMAVADEEQAELRAEAERLTEEIERLTEDEMERPDWDDKVAKAQMLEYANARAESAEARLDALVADLRGLADEWERGADAWGACTREWVDLRELRAVLDKHAGEQAQGGEGRG